MSFKTISEYNKDLVNNLTRITLGEYFKTIHAQFHSNQDISFMEYFLELCLRNRDEFVVNHAKLIEYGVITSGRSVDVLRAMNQFDLQKDEDFRLRNVAQSRLSTHGGSNGNKKEYILTPRAFKMCLMRAKNTKVYSNYYILLEEVFAYYTAYEREYAAKVLSMKDEKIDKLEKKLDHQSEKLDQLLQFGNKLVGQNDNLQLSIDMTRDELAESLNYLVDKSYHSTIDPADELKITHIAVLAPDNDFHEGKTILVRGQASQIIKVKHKNYETHIPVIDMTYNANAINLIENAKQEFFRVRHQYVHDYNVPIIAYNAELKEAIKEHNKRVRRYNKTKPLVPMIERVYRLEKKDKLFNSDIPVDFRNTWIYYKRNKHFSYDQVVDCINSVNKKTQSSPVGSDVSD